MQTLFRSMGRGNAEHDRLRVFRRFRLYAWSGLLTLGAFTYMTVASNRAAHYAREEADALHRLLAEGSYGPAYDAADGAFKLRTRRQDFISYALKDRKDAGPCDDSGPPLLVASWSTLGKTSVRLEYRSPCEHGTLRESFTILVDWSGCHLLRYEAHGGP